MYQKVECIRPAVNRCFTVIHSSYHEKFRQTSRPVSSCVFVFARNVVLQMRAPFSLWMNFPRYSPSFEVFVNDVVSVFLYSTQIGKRMTEILSVVSDLAEAPIYFCTLLSCAFCTDRWWTQNVEVGLQICYLDPKDLKGNKTGAQCVLL